jgi:hypothetical protein
MRDARADVFADSQRVGTRGAGQQQRELLSADAEQHIHPASTPADDPNERLQHVVSGGVTKPVVDGLETIDVEDQQRRRLSKTVAPLDRVNQARIEMPPVECAGERVGDRLGLEPSDPLVEPEAW